MPTRLVILRHGQTEWSLSGQHTGSTDLPLLDEGRAQAASVRSRFATLAFERVATSLLRRAAETAALAGFPDAAQHGELVEWDYGAHEGLTTAQIREDRPGWDIFRDGVPDGESLSSVAERADRVVEWAREVPVVLRWNDACHIDDEWSAHAVFPDD